MRRGTKLSLKLGSQIPISTSYTPIATGGAGVNPLSSPGKDIGVNVDMTPTVTGGRHPSRRHRRAVAPAPTSTSPASAFRHSPAHRHHRLRLRDGESNLLAACLRRPSKRDQRVSGLIHGPFFKELFSSNTSASEQQDIVILLTPHIVRTHEITEADLRPIYIGSQQQLGIGGPPPLIAAQPEPAPAPVAPAAPPAPAGQPAGTTAIVTIPPPGTLRGPGGTTVVAPPGSSPVPGTVLCAPCRRRRHHRTAAARRATAAPIPTPPVAEPTPATPPAVPTTSPGIGSAQVLISPPGPTFRVGGGPYTVPLLINEASRISTVTLTLVFDPTKLRVRSVQEGSFLRAGGISVVFSQAVSGNRIDISLARGADATGASGTGVLAAILFDAIAPGPVTMTLSGTATGPGGTVMGLRFTPVTVTEQ
jgi:hypothetical protein